MIEVTAGIIEKDNKVLLARRKPGKHLEGYWEFPGGKIENDESPKECLRRELLEEFSIETEILDFIAASVYEYPGKTIKLLGYLVKLVKGNFQLKDHDKIIWVYPDELKTYKLAPADIPIAKEYGKQRFNQKNNSF
ncbi:(deoxy)nucleoside triphosphate pyrophosphohydrolase [Adhaeribacter rhizoryzae]|uniref:8-oxo-dGTP diphosphatase n=1 Tax=Adhaeribacter rhizoryzae TaxID=2607907 RepID=A0A5M6CUI9_9BACT|nr:(deoxy)nucleoside triphosphate pyrophosphohydrolase [Adhaeribacter rhizoryzae]KAA5538861.1 (deoxy)nucleoside triphosphate pyrophosphohydrolase [Adhaeribacter rhizoryzae]